MSNERRPTRELLDWLTAVADSLPGPPAGGPSGPPAPVSPELDQLLWLFAEDALNEDDERRLWELVASEPGGPRHFRALLESLDRHAQPDLSTLPAGLIARLGLPSQAAGERSGEPGAGAVRGGGSGPRPRSRPARTTSLSDICLRVARDFLAASLGSATDLPFAGAAARGGVEEQPSSFRWQLLKRPGIFEIVIDHAGEQRCDVALRARESSPGYPLAALTVELRDGEDQLVLTTSFVDRVARFRHLDLGQHVLVLVQDGVEIDRITLTLEPLTE